MLQPVQLEDVSVRYAREIAELREFLEKAGVPVGSAGALQCVVASLRENRGFRRDLTSHVWVVLHSCGPQVSYSDLLGLLAIAAAGTRFAAAAGDGEAHELLRFLMDARGSFDGRPQPGEVANVRALAGPADVAVVRPQRMMSEDAAAIFARRDPTDDERPLAFEMPEAESDRRPVVWAGIAALLLLAVGGGVWLHERASADRATPAAIATTSEPSAAETAVPPRSESRDAVRSSATRTVGRSSRHVGVASKVAPAPHVVDDRRPAVVAAATGSSANETTPAPVIRMPASKVATAPKSAVAAKKSTAPVVVASSNAPEIPRWPRLLRRPTAGKPAAGSGDEAGGSDDDAGSASANHGATVHPISLGTMASNVIYSPAPAYPAMASASHVEGEVKLEAEVDRDGSVVSTRVISGPPLLRSAAEDALQHWHYRPYVYDGKPIAMNAMVVMEFELPK